jgi:hypothetical protein
MIVIRAAIRYVLNMDPNQFPTEPSTTRPVAIEPVVDTTRYVRRLRRVSIIAYALPLIATLLPIPFLGGFPGGDSWASVFYLLFYGVFLAFFLNVFILMSEVVLLIMTIRYLVKGWLVGRARTVAIVSLCLYSLLAIGLIVLDILWSVG